jgi:hypothetical protein
MDYNPKTLEKIVKKSPKIDANASKPCQTKGSK